MINFDFSGKVVAITGARRGIGRSLAFSFAEARADVALISKTPYDSGLLSQLEKFEVRSKYYAINLLNRELRKLLIERIVNDFGKIDILINNAGHQACTSIFDYELDQWDSDIELMLTAVFDLSVQAARHMKEQRCGKIINVASISSFQGARNIIGYSTAKHGLVGLTKCLANELAIHGINVNAVAPGIVETDMARNVFNDPQRCKELSGRVPAGRFATTEDIVPTVMFLASEESKFIHGHVLVVDGGWMGR